MFLVVKCTPIVRHSLTIGGAFFMAKFSSKRKNPSGETIFRWYRKWKNNC